MRITIKDPKKIILFSVVAAVVILSGIVRVYKLGDIPPGLYPDIAMNGNDALDSIKNGQFKLFYPENNGREGLFIWLISLSFVIFGPSIWAIRIVSAIIGVLTVLGTYLLAKELFYDRQEPPADIVKELPADNGIKNAVAEIFKPANFIGLLSAILIAFSFWHISFSRMGFRVIMVPFVLVFFGYFFFRGFHKNSVLSLIISGLFFGAGFYTYIGFRMSVLLLPFILLPYFVGSFKQRGAGIYLKNFLWFIAAVFVVALPIGIYFLTHFGDFIGRAGGVSIFSQLSPVKAFFTSLFSHLLMFNFRGDYNWRHNFSGLPMLPVLCGLLFVAGASISIIRLIRAFKERNYDQIGVYNFLIFGFFTALLPGILTIEGIPHALRVLGVVPFVYIFSGIGGFIVFRFLYSNTAKKFLVILGGILMVVSICFSQLDLYFNNWAKNREVINAFSSNYVELGNYLNSIEDGIKIYVIVNQGGVPVPYPNGIPVPAQTPIFIERTKYGEPRATYLKHSDYYFRDPGPTGYPELTPLDEINPKDRAIIILMDQNDPDLFVTLLRKFPKGHFWKAGSLMMFRLNFEISTIIQ